MGPADDRRRIGAAKRGVCSLLIALTLGGAACDRHDDSTAKAYPQSPPPAASPAAAPTRPATRPSATLTVDGRPLAFPAAKLVITKKSDGIDALLCSDDPPTAIQDSYGGNSFFFEMRLDIADPQDLPRAVWICKVPDHQAADSTNGIFLNGDRRQLQPADVRVSFAPRGDQIVATLTGRFVAIDSHDPGGVVRSVQVDGSLLAAVQEQ